MKPCACGRTKDLKKDQYLGESLGLHLYNCPCGSTYAVEPMKIDGFHRGLQSWVASFSFGGFDYVAYVDRRTERWNGIHSERLAAEQVEEMDRELTARLKEWLKSQKVVTE